MRLSYCQLWLQYTRLCLNFKRKSQSLQPQFFRVFAPSSRGPAAVPGLRKPPAKEISSFETSVKVNCN